MGEGKKKLPKGWAWASLGDTGEYFNGMAFKPTDWEVTGRPIIRIQNLNNPEKPINRTNKNVRERYLVKSGDLLVSWSATLDTFKWTGEEAVLNQHIFNVRPKAELDKQFIFHTLKYQIKVLINSEHMHGSTMRHINRKPFMSHRIPLPSLAEQKRIVDKVDELFSSIEAGERAIARARTALTRYRKAVLKAAVTGELTADWRAKNPPNETAQDLIARILKARYSAWEKAELEKLDAKGKARPETDKEWVKFRARYKEPVEPNPDKLFQLPEIPRSWLWASLSSLLLGIDAGKSFKCDERPPEDGETGLVKVSAVSWGEFDEEESKTITDAARIDLRYEINSGDLLISRANTIELVGASVIVRGFSRHLLLSDKILRIRLIEDMRHWVNQLFLSHLGRMQIETRSSGNQMSMRNISQDGLKKLAIPLPSMDEQAEIVSRVEQALSKADKAEATLCAQAKQAKALKQAVLKAAFEGRLVPQDPKDEPASELLKRIKAAS